MLKNYILKILDGTEFVNSYFLEKNSIPFNEKYDQLNNDLNQQIDKYKDENTSLKQQLKQSNEKRNVYIDEMAKIKQHNKKLEKTIKKQEYEHLKIDNKLTEYKAEAENLKRDKIELDNKLNSLKNSYLLIEKTLTEYQDEITTKADEIYLLKTKNNEYVDKINDLKSKINHLEKLKELDLEMINQLNNQVKDMEVDIKDDYIDAICTAIRCAGDEGCFGVNSVGVGDYETILKTMDKEKNKDNMGSVLEAIDKQYDVKTINKKDLYSRPPAPVKIDNSLDVSVSFNKKQKKYIASAVIDGNKIQLFQHKDKDFTRAEVDKIKDYYNDFDRVVLYRKNKPAKKYNFNPLVLSYTDLDNEYRRYCDGV